MPWRACCKVYHQCCDTRTSGEDLTGMWHKGKRKVIHAAQESAGGDHLPLLGLEPVGGEPSNVCDVWPVRSQT